MARGPATSTAEPAATSATLAACTRCGWLNLPGQACEHCGTVAASGSSGGAAGGAADELVIDGRYRVLGQIGEGGMGAVYRVEHIRMRKVMALKVLRPDLAKKGPSVERFRREAQIISRLSHPNTITVFDSGETEAGLVYLAMEYVPGRDLADIVEKEGPLEEGRALEIITQVLRSLSEAHEAGIIHRDVKPANVMITRTRDEPNMVKVLDFGIAKLIEQQTAGARDITGGADMVGTPSCMSPEQARGKELDARSDVYSVAATLFTLLAGRGPFVGGPLQVVTLHLTEPAPKLREVCGDRVFSDGVEAIVAKGLAKDPAHRFQSADEMRRAIERVAGDPLASMSMDGELNLARREDWDAFERSFRRQRALVPIVVLGLAALVVAGALYSSHRRAIAAEQGELGALTHEVEPNDVAPAANRVGFEAPVIGHVGGQGNVDLDLFDFSVSEPGLLTATLSGVPQVNLFLEIFRVGDDGATASPVAAVDDAPLGGGEILGGLPVYRGRYLARVRDRRRLDEAEGPPRENLAVPYSLRLALSPQGPFDEVEPNNDLDHAMAVSLERAVLGGGGVSSLELVTRPGEAPPLPWSVDNYRLRDLAPTELICGILGGVPGATLRLTAYRADSRRPLRAVQVRPERAVSVCVRGETALAFEVRVDVGSTGEVKYPLAFVSSQAGGFTGLLSLARALPTLDRAAEARQLIDAALEALPRADDVAVLRDALARTPEVLGDAVESSTTP